MWLNTKDRRENLPYSLPQKHPMDRPPGPRSSEALRLACLVLRLLRWRVEAGSISVGAYG